MAGVMSMPTNMAKLLREQAQLINANTDNKAAEVSASVGADGDTTRQQLTSDTDAVDLKLNEITAVNGQIDTNVQAINSHTTAELSALSMSAIKSIQRGEIRISSNSYSSEVTIDAVDLSKSVVINAGVQGASPYVTVQLKDSTTVEVRRNAYSGSTYISWAVIEYA